MYPALKSGQLILAGILLLCLAGCAGPAAEGFADCADCPRMTVIPAGSFNMGTPPAEKGQDSERPIHKVAITDSFAVSIYEITFDQWDACAADGICAGKIDDEGWGRGDRPVINLTYADALTYTGWLSAKTGRNYRLLSEAEWEYAARAGSEAAFSWGDEIKTGLAHCRACENPDEIRQSLPVGQFPPNAFGLYDMHGNVSEYVADCWNSTYDGAPTDGSAWTTGECNMRILRGGAWRSIPWVLRSGARFKRAEEDATDISGFRVARDLTD